MNHSFQTEGFGVRLRPVRADDAAFIVWLRGLEHTRGKIGDTTGDVTAQEDWIREYLRRPGDYYFLIETVGGTRLGTFGLYNELNGIAESGRFIVRPEVPAAAPALYLACDLAFGPMQLRELVARSVAINRAVHSFNRKFGFRQTKTVPAEQTIAGQPVDMVYFVLPAGEWPAARQRVASLVQYSELQISAWQDSHRNATMRQPGAENP